jgi:hypothetical protein
MHGLAAAGAAAVPLLLPLVRAASSATPTDPGALDTAGRA